MSAFYVYFKENMEALGLVAPESLFGSLTSAIGSISAILAQIDNFGRSVSVGELIGAGTRLELLGVASACTASFYAGACIGSLAVAAGRTLSGGTSLADVIHLSHRYRIHRPWLRPLIARYPGIHDQRVASRGHYARLA